MNRDDLRTTREGMVPLQLDGPPHELVVSYRTLRKAVGTVGLLLPLVLAAGGWLLGIEIQETMSAYYHTDMRDCLVGALFALGVLLFCYQGYDAIESWTANVAALLAACLAIFPADQRTDPLMPHTPSGYVHTVSGGLFFLVLAVYSLVHFPRSGDGELDRPRRLIYRSTGIVLVVSTATMGGLILFADGELRAAVHRYNVLFWLEWLAIWSFAIAWLTKGRAIVTEIVAELLEWPMAIVTHALERKSARDD